jgi:hypothetical protein
VNFCQDVDLESLTPHLDTLVNKLYLMVANGGKTYLQEQALVSLSTVADRAGVEFTPYYERVMPLIITFMSEAEDFVELRGKAVECASFIGMGLGINFRSTCRW